MPSSMIRDRSTWLQAVMAVSLACALASCEPSSQASAPPALPSVTVANPISREVTEWDEFSGQFAAMEYVEVRARVSGHLQSIHFQDGQMVKKGDLLFVVDPRPFEITLASAKAQLAQATARLDLAKIQLERAAKLREKDFVAASVYDQRLEEMRGAAAAVDSARATVHAAELDVSFTRVTAPLSGRVSRHEVSIGNMVIGSTVMASGTTRLTTIVSLDPIRFTFDMSEGDFLSYQRAAADGRLKSARDNTVPVYARLSDEDGWPHEGRIDFVDNQVDRSAGTIRARAVFPNEKLLITPGQFGQIRLPSSAPHLAIMIPDNVIVTDQSRKIVMAVKEDGTVEPRLVQLGPKIDGLRVIRSGLSETDTIVINGLMQARPGAKVSPQKGTIEPHPQAS